MQRALQDELKKISSLPVTIQSITLGALLARLFNAKGVRLTVVGGAAVQFYTQADYTTHDLDVVLQGDTQEVINAVMGALRFKRTSTYRHFEHPLFNFVIEFPPAPVAVGSRILDKISAVETAMGTVQVIRVEDILMDRIIAGVEWKDTPSLAQARLIWLKNKGSIDGRYLTDFAKQEGYLKELKAIMRG